MGLLTSLGLASIALTILFTVYLCYGASTHSGQSIMGSLIEAWTNVAIGFCINFIANLILLPLIGAHVTPGANFWLGCIFTAISVVRSFVIRRYFNARIVAFAKRASGSL